MNSFNRRGQYGRRWWGLRRVSLRRGGPHRLQIIILIGVDFGLFRQLGLINKISRVLFNFRFLRLRLRGLCWIRFLKTFKTNGLQKNFSNKKHKKWPYKTKSLNTHKATFICHEYICIIRSQLELLLPYYFDKLIEILFITNLNRIS